MEVLDADAQVAFLGVEMLELGRRVKTDRLFGTFAVEFSAHDGEIRTTVTKLDISKRPPTSGMKK